MCTIHANSAREAVTKMCTLPLLAGENVGHHTFHLGQRKHSIDCSGQDGCAATHWSPFGLPLSSRSPRRRKRTSL